MATRRANILILCKTYPSPSSRYSETSCVAGMEDNGTLIRLYPVPFRLLTQDQKFKKWQWVEARVEKARDDHRPESHRIYVDNLVPGEEISPRQNWWERLQAIRSLPIYESFEALEAAREQDNISLGLLRPQRLVDLEIRAERHKEWTREERDKLMRDQAPFRARLLEEFSRKDLLFLMGNMHRHRHQWLIVSLIYPPKPPQQTLF